MCRLRKTIKPHHQPSVTMRVVGEHLIDSTLPIDIELDGQTTEPKEVLKSRSIAQHGQQVPQEHFPYFNHEYKVASISGGIDRLNSELAYE
ncbi:hypothetical protein CR513_30281, partial [Mucuna pruriens]